MLIDGGAKVSAADADEWTPLLFATKCGHQAVARILLDGRAGVTATNRDGKTPLKIATENKHDAVVRLLTDRGLSVNNQLPP
jgi:ankyrin repeat protein